jgi:hypothetical protein
MEENVCGEYREHGMYEECRGNFDLKIWVDELAVNGKRIIKLMLSN